MAFITTDAFRTTVAARLGQANSASSPAHWGPIADDAVASAYGAIVSALSGRLFTPDQIAAWDRGAEYNRRIALCHYFREAALRGDGGYDAQSIEAMCQCEAELLTVKITANGAIVYPGMGRISTGEYDTSEDLHTMCDTL